MSSSSEDYAWSPTLLESQFASVVFLSVEDSYPTDADIECRYIVPENSILTASLGDRIAVFQVGWEDISEGITWLPAAVQSSECEEVEGEHCVLFRAHTLPKDDGQYYQFCYVTANDEVRGQSVPFHFHRPQSDELVTVDDDADSELVMVRTRTSVMDEKLRSTVKNNAALEKENHSLNEKLQQQHERYVQVMESYETCKKELASVQEELTQIKQAWNFEGKELTTSLQRLEESSREDRDASSRAIAAMQVQIYTLESQVNAKEQRVQQLTSELQEKTRELQKSQRELQTTLITVTINETEKAGLQHDLQEMENMLSALERSKALATDEIQAHTEFSNKVCRDLEFSQLEADSLREKVKVLEKAACEAGVDINLYKTTVQNMEGEALLLSQQLEASKIQAEQDKENLQLTIDQLNNKIQQLEKLQVEEKTALQSQVQELHERLKQGAVEYQVKFVECLRLTRKVEKLISKLKGNRGSLTGKDHSSQTEAIKRASQDKDTNTEVNLSESLERKASVVDSCSDQYSRPSIPSGDSATGVTVSRFPIGPATGLGFKPRVQTLAQAACNTLQADKEANKMSSGDGPTTPEETAITSTNVTEILNVPRQYKTESIQEQSPDSGIPEVTRNPGPPPPYLDDIPVSCVLPVHPHPTYPNYQYPSRPSQNPEPDRYISSSSDRPWYNNIYPGSATRYPGYQRVYPSHSYQYPRYPQYPHPTSRYPVVYPCAPPVYPTIYQSTPTSPSPTLHSTHVLLPPPLLPMQYDHNSSGNALYENQRATVIQIPSGESANTYSPSSRGSILSLQKSPVVPQYPVQAIPEEVIIQETRNSGLPPPMQPEITPQARLAALAAVTRNLSNGSDNTEPTSNIAPSSGLRGVDVENKRWTGYVCPVCEDVLNPDWTEELIQRHICEHFARECPVCHLEFPPDQQDELQLHVDTHFASQ